MATLTVYSDAHIETATVDGYVVQGYGSGAGQSWLTIRSAAGWAAVDDISVAIVQIQSDSVTDKWQYLYRSILLFDTSALPDDCTITQVLLKVRGYSKADGLGISPRLTVVTSAPASNTALVAGDFDSLGVSYGLSNTIYFSSFDTLGWNTFTIADLSVIQKTGITKLGLREGYYDVYGITPAWSPSASTYMKFYTSDAGPGYKPYLEITYTVNTSQSFSVAMGQVASIEQSIEGGSHDISQTATAIMGQAPTVTQVVTGTQTHTAAIGQVASVISEINSNDYLCIASQGSGSVKTSSPVGASWTTCAKDSAGAVVQSSYFAEFQGRLCSIASNGACFAYSDVNDITSNWNYISTFPNLQNTATDLIVTRDPLEEPSLYALTPQGIYSLDIFTNFYFYPTPCNWSYNANSGKCGIEGRNGTYLACDKAIFHISGTSISPYGPDIDNGMVEEQQGIITDMINVDNWFVIAVNGGANNKSGIFKRYITQSHWHPVYITSAINNPIKSLFYKNGTLYFGESTNVKYLSFPASTDNVKYDSSYTYASSGSLVTSWFYSDHEGIPKVAHKFSVTTEGCNDTEYITLYYQKDLDTTWTSLGTFKSSPNPDDLYWGTSQEGLEFNRIRFKFTLCRGGTTTASPKLTGWTFQYRICPPNLWRWRFIAECRTKDGFVGKALIDKLKQAIGTNTLIIFYPDGDRSSTAYNVTLSNMPGREHTTEMGQEGEYTIQVDQVIS